MGERGEVLAIVNAGKFVEWPGHDVSLGGVSARRKVAVGELSRSVLAGCAA